MGDRRKQTGQLELLNRQAEPELQWSGLVLRGFGGEGVALTTVDSKWANLTLDRRTRVMWSFSY